MTTNTTLVERLMPRRQSPQRKAQVYSGQGFATKDWSVWFSARRWCYINFYGVSIGRWFIGVQRFSRHSECAKVRAFSASSACAACAEKDREIEERRADTHRLRIMVEAWEKSEAQCAALRAALLEQDREIILLRARSVPERPC